LTEPSFVLICQCYLDFAGCKNVTQAHSSSQSDGFIVTSDDQSSAYETASTFPLNIRLNSCIGSPFHLTVTHAEILHAISKLVKLAHHHGKGHDVALIHLLSRLCDIIFFGG
jgi:hypothetical protein